MAIFNSYVSLWWYIYSIHGVYKPFYRLSTILLVIAFIKGIRSSQPYSLRGLLQMERRLQGVRCCESVKSPLEWVKTLGKRRLQTIAIFFWYLFVWIQWYPYNQTIDIHLLVAFWFFGLLITTAKTWGHGWWIGIFWLSSFSSFEEKMESMNSEIDRACPWLTSRSCS